MQDKPRSCIITCIGDAPEAHERQRGLIRPGSYPGRDVPEHIHIHVIEPGRATYYIDDVVFSDDSKLTPRQIQKVSRGRGGLGIVTPERREGVWLVRRDIVLRQDIPGYPPRPR